MDTLLVHGIFGGMGLALWLKWVRDDLPGTPEDRDSRGLLG